MVFYNVKQAAREHHQKYKVIKNKNTYSSNSINNLTGTSDNGFSSSSGSDYSYGVSAAVVMPQITRTQSNNNIHPKNYGFNLTARSSKKCSSLDFIILNSSIFFLYFVKLNGQSLNSLQKRKNSSSSSSYSSSSGSINSKTVHQPETLSDRKKTTIIVHKIPEGVQTSREYNYTKLK